MIEREWAGENPYFLVIETGEEATGIDLDFHGWATTNADLMRKPGVWHLIRKDGVEALRVFVMLGEQPYYTARHVGKLGAGGSNEIIAHGIGKKLLDGNVMRLWALPDGTVCGGDDVDDIGVMLVERMGPR